MAQDQNTNTPLFFNWSDGKATPAQASERGKLKNLVDEKGLVALFPIFTLSCLRNWRFKRQGPPYHKIMAKRVFYDPEAVQAWLDSHVIDPEK